MVVTVSVEFRSEQFYSVLLYSDFPFIFFLFERQKIGRKKIEEDE